MIISSSGAQKFLIQARIKEFAVPPIIDGLVIGRQGSIGAVAWSNSLSSRSNHS
jgi:hypothetical protein